jgi:hypothetical protein
MFFARKLKPAPFPKEFLIPIIILPIFFLLIALAGPRLAYLFLIPVFLFVGLINLLTWVRARNSGHLLVMIAMVLITILSIMFVIYGKGAPKPIMILLIILLIGSFPFIWYMTLTRRTKWRKREMLELAAMPVDETESGFTERPFPAGKIDFTRSELDSFIKFMKSRMIALPVFSNEKIVFVMTTDYGFVMGFTTRYDDKTWISVDNEGEVLVHISRGDYMLYRDNFSYDKLCESLGQVFIEFFGFYKKGEGQRIIDRLNDLRLSPITEG